MKVSTYILTLVLVCVAVFFPAFYVFKTYPQIMGGAPATPTPIRDRACTEEAKLCPDGSYVSRTGPNCEFAQCPTVEKFSDICTQDADCVATCPRDCLNKESAKLGGRAACLVKPSHSCQCLSGHCKAN